MQFRLHDYECPHCHLPSHAATLLSTNNFGEDIYSNAYDPHADIGSSYLMCPFCRELFIKESDCEYERNISFLVAKDVTQTIKKSSVDYDKNVEMFLKYYGGQKAFKKYAQDIINCFPKRYAGKVDILNLKRSGIYTRFKSRIELLRRVRACDRSTINNPCEYSDEETSLFRDLLDVVRKKRISISAIDRGIEFHAATFHQCKEQYPFRQTVLLRLIWEMERGVLSDGELSRYDPEYKSALSELLNYFRNRKDHLKEDDLLLMAEILRRTGQFDEALKTLGEIRSDKEVIRDMVEEMIEHIHARDTKVFTLQRDEYNTNLNLGG